METAEAERPSSEPRRPSTRVLEFVAIVPLLLWLGYAVVSHPGEFGDPYLLMWAGSIAVVDLLPIPSSLGLPFSLSFPLQLAVALIYPPPVAGAVAFLGTADTREFRREVSLEVALWNHAQIALSVIAESVLFHSIVTLDANWYAVAPTVLAAAIVGYAVNALLVAWYFKLQTDDRFIPVLREMHVGVFGEFLLSYMGLALFSVFMATSFVEIGPLSLIVFVAPLAFARQMFTRTYSLHQATQEIAAREQEKEYQAHHDSLTDLPNRVLFHRNLEDAIAKASEAEGILAVMVIDLDGFKEVNDTLGHHYGDLLLKEIGPRLSTALRDEDVMARLGGDEFGIVLPALPQPEVAVAIARRLMEEFERPVIVDGLALDISGSIGIALFPTDSQDVDTLLRRADVAMYDAKEAGTGFELYHPSLDRYSPSRLTLVGQVRPAIENDEFLLYYQPKVRIADGKIVGVEALIRWQHPQRGLVPPDEFIPLVERTVLLRPLTAYVLNQALRQTREWHDLGLPIQTAVNLSARNLADSELPDQVADLLGAWELPSSALGLELTESFVMSDSLKTATILNRLRDVGVELSVDDFGTGYSSLSYLSRLPIDEIKVDRSFVGDMLANPNNATIVRATVDLGRNLGLRVVAEGVEDAATLQELARLKCHVAQGYFLSRPLPADQITPWLMARVTEGAASGHAVERETRHDADIARADAPAPRPGHGGGVPASQGRPRLRAL
jgi:diguanylate cyclase (GGDEF)-like protein